jgi:hypothetical protein
MNFRLFGCGKFKWLSIERFDRELSPKEDSFYRKHREVCFTCMRYEQQGTNAMNLLTAAAIEPEISEDFDEKVLRVLRKPRKRVAFSTLSPVFAGAIVAGLALVATLQLLSQSPIQLWKATPATGAQGADNRYYNKDQSTFPSLVLPRELNR